MSKKLFIGNCAFGLDSSTLESFITSNGVKVSAVEIIRDRETGRSRGFGFAELADSETEEGAIEALNGKEIEGRALTVSKAREKTANHKGANQDRYADRW